jgi:hypothetical protein
LSSPASWQVQRQNSGTVVQSGTGASATLTYASLSSYVGSGLTALNFVTQQAVTLTIIAPTVSGVSLTPAPGTYTCSASSSVCQPGGTVQLSATNIPSGYAFNDWVVNGQVVSTSASYTITMPQSGSVSVAAGISNVLCSGSACPPPPNGGGSSLPVGQIAGVVFMLSGAGLTFLGVRRRR